MSRHTNDQLTSWVERHFVLLLGPQVGGAKQVDDGASARIDWFAAADY